ncbi:MAG: hypothetical protein WC842_01625 [Candidatus Paceibacterota bacterium]|jgi:hypothetical protein
MKAFSFFLIITIIFIIALISMNSGALRFFNTNPNLVFAFIAGLIALRVKNSIVCSLLFLLLLLAFLFFPFWIVEYSLLCGVGFISLFARSKLTGNSISDVLILSSIGSLLFSLCLWFFSHSSIDIYQIVLQVAYNSICGVILVLILKPLIKRGGISRL